MSESLPLVHIDQLQVGVFVSLDLAWIDHPFLVNSFLIKSEKQLRTLREMGLRTVAYDPGRSEARPLVLEHEPTVPEPPHIEPGDQQVMDEKRQRSGVMLAHRERIEQCEKAYTECVGSTKSVIADILRDPAQATAHAGAMVGSMASTFLDGDGATVTLVASRKLDEASHQHALNVMILTMMLGKGMGLKREIFEAAGIGALLHDIGKTRISPSILRNAQRSRHEETVYRMHGEYGMQMLGEHVSAPVRAVIREHHEFVDGSGFPSGLQGHQINPIARMVAITNRYDALCNTHALADALTPAEALSRMFARESARFDSSMLAAFVKELGVYPPGSFVRLSTGSIAIVIGVTPGNTLKPTVLVYEPGVPRREALILSLADAADVAIECVLRPVSLSQSIVEYLNPRMKLAYFAHKTGG
jgi:HD-GYP domain-containing protein (c-di-GMP phosphodiesterase class II)